MRPTTAIFIQDQASGEYDYNDTAYSKLISATGDILPLMSITYEGSKTGIGNKFIIPGAILCARKKKSNEFTYIGQVQIVRLLRAQTKTVPAKYQLIIEHVTINNIEYKTVLKRMTGGAGPKVDGLKRMGFELDASRKGANIQSGLNAIKPLPIT